MCLFVPVKGPFLAGNKYFLLTLINKSTKILLLSHTFMPFNIVYFDLSLSPSRVKLFHVKCGTSLVGVQNLFLIFLGFWFE